MSHAVRHGTILVTGATGFVGGTLCSLLAERGYLVRRALRTPSAAYPHDPVVGDVAEPSEIAAALRGVHAVIHLAARTHVLRDTAENPLAEYWRINVLGTRRLASAAAAAGVRRFVFLSSIKVNGERTTSRPYSAEDAPQPQDGYGVSKWEAEVALQEIAAKAGIESVILRPPLVYGPGVKGNFLRLLALVARGMPLPLAAIDNRRSLVHVGNLADAIAACMEAPQAAGRTYLVSDGEDLSTPELARRMAVALKVRSRLFACPTSWLERAGALLGRRDEIARITGSLQVDSTTLRRELGWRPPYTVDQGLEDTAAWYRVERG